MNETPNCETSEDLVDVILKQFSTNIFYMNEIQNALQTIINDEIGKLLIDDITDNELISSLSNDYEFLKKEESLSNGRLLHISERFHFKKGKYTIKDAIIIKILSAEKNRIIDNQLWKENIAIDLAGKVLNNIDCSLPINDRVSNIKPTNTIR